MIGYLRGKVLDATPERVLLDVGGVGYELQVPLSTYTELDRADASRSVGIWIHTHVREDAIELFGFWTEREKLLFERLISVSGIGPRLARVVLSGLAPEELVAALTASDVARLTTVPGIGKRTAERMVLELRDRLGDLAAEAPVAAGAGDDLVPALVNLGYKVGEAEKAVARARRELPDGDSQELIRASLALLSRA